MDDNTLRALQSNYMRMTGGLQMPEQQAEAKPKRSGIVSWLPAIGGTVGSIGGGILGGVGGFFGGAGIGAVPGAAVGAGAGGAAGGALGEWLAQKLSGESKDGYDMGNIFQEGAINGVLGAVPLGKVGQIGKGVVKGVGERALVRGGEEVAGQVAKKGAEEAAGKVASGGIKNWLGGKLLGQADDTALRAAKVGGQKDALRKFQSEFGEDLGAYMRKNDLIGKTSQDIEENLIGKLNKQYGKNVGVIDRPITSSDLLAKNQKSLENLLYSSASSENKRLADDVLKEIDQIFKDGAIDPKRLNQIKGEYQTLARNAYKLGADTKASVNEKVAEYLKKTLQGMSKDITKTDDLARTGQEINKAFKASDIIAKGEQVGRGNLTLSMGDMMVGAPMLALANPGAAVASVAAKRAINSPRVQSFIANKLASAGERLVAGGGEKVAEGAGKAIFDTTAKGMLKQQVPGRAIQSLGIMSAGAQPSGDGGAAMNPNSPFNPSSPNYNPNLVDPTAVGDPNDLGSIMGVEESPYSLQAMQADVMRDPKNADEYMKIYQIMNPQSQQNLSQSSKNAMASSGNAINTIDQLEALFAKAGGGSGRIGGKLKGIAASAGLDEDARVYNNLSQASVTQIAKALAGSGSGTVSDMDAKVIIAALPTISDTKAEAKAKFAALRQRLENSRNNTMYYGAGGDVGTDLQSLMMAQ